tara:strand:- start:190 stop:891 length:702 start_codon:yes stop_codon:yes gene_type:complete
MESKKILLVEDDPNFGTLLKDYLALNDYNVTHAKDGIEGLIMFKNSGFDLCILDVMMPRKDGFSLSQDMRVSNKEVPIIFLTAKTLKEDVLKGYSVGSDDYINKPFDSEVLLYKIKAILQRKELDKTAESEQFEFNIGQFFFNSKLRHLSLGVDGDPQKLSQKESKLLRMLAIHKNDLMPRKIALIKIWRGNNYFTSRSMDVYISKLRKYLKEDDTVEILNIHGEGFELVEKL